MSLFSMLAQASSDFNFNSSEFDSFNTTTTSTDAAAAAGLAFGFIAIAVLANLLMWLFMSFCLMKVFKKAGRQDAWAAFIPVYNLWVYFEVAGRPGWWALLSLIPIVGIFIILVMNIIASMDMAKSFGKTSGFGILLAFLPIVGYPMLAFGDATYNGPAGPEGASMPPASPGASVPPTQAAPPNQQPPVQ